MKRSKRLWAHIANYRLQSLFFRNFAITIVMIIIPLIIILSMAIGSNERIFKEEMEKLIRSNLAHSSRMLDTLFKDSSYVAGSLSLDGEVREFIFPLTEEMIYRDSHARNMISTLNSLTARYKLISSIYIYGEKQNRIVTGQVLIDEANFDDINWMEKYEECRDGQPFFFSRNMFAFTDNTYDETPNGITLMKPIIRLGSDNPLGAVIINMEHAKLTEHIKVNEIDGRLYILQKSGVVLYSRERSDINKGISQVTAIPSFPEKRKASQIFVGFNDNALTALSDSSETDLTYLLQIPLAHFGDQQQRMRKLSATLILIAFATALIASFFLSWNSYQPIRKLLNVLESPNNSVREGMPSNEIRYIAQNIIRTLNANKALKDELTDQLSLLDHTRTAALQAQINPHFLYNTLESIRWGAMDLTQGENRVSHMISDLAKLLRLSLETMDNTTTVETEVTHACMFIRLLKARYPEKLTVNWDIDEELNSCAILKLCLQPLIENAYYHGIKPTREAGSINIAGRTVGKTLSITIEDDGRGIDTRTLESLKKKMTETKPLPEKHIGILNVHQRIQLVFGESYGIEISKGETRGTRVSLLFPLEYPEEWEKPDTICS